MKIGILAATFFVLTALGARAQEDEIRGVIAK